MTTIRVIVARGRTERGFGMIELLAAMTVMLVGVLAVCRSSSRVSSTSAGPAR